MATETPADYDPKTRFAYLVGLESAQALSIQEIVELTELRTSMDTRPRASRPLSALLDERERFAQDALDTIS